MHNILIKHLVSLWQGSVKTSILHFLLNQLTSHKSPKHCMKVGMLHSQTFALSLNEPLYATHSLFCFTIATPQVSCAQVKCNMVCFNINFACHHVGLQCIQFVTLVLNIIFITQSRLAH